MADVNTAAPTQPAATPPPEPQQPVAPEKQRFSIPKDPEAYAEWRQKGLPADAESETHSSSGKKAPPEKTEPAQEAGDKQRQPRSDKRKEEIQSDIQELTRRRDAILDDLVNKRLEVRLQAAKDETERNGKQGVKAEPPAAPVRTAAPEEPKEPDQADFDDWGEYLKAAKKYQREVIELEVRKHIEAFEQKQARKVMDEEVDRLMKDAQKRYGETAIPQIVTTAQAIFQDKEVPAAVTTALNRSDVLIDALYVMGSNEQSLKDFVALAKRDPLAALEEWFTVQRLVKEELGKQKPPADDTTPARGADGKFQAAKTIPPPPTELNGNVSGKVDETARAVKNGDFTSFKATRDREDMARWKGLA